MKKIPVLLLTLMMFGLMKAQDADHIGFKEKDMFVSGLIGYHSVSKPNDSKVQKFSLIPRFGYFVNDFVAVGGRLGYNYGTTKDPDGNKIEENNTFTIGIFGRYYLLPGSKFSPFGEIGVGYGTTSDINDHTVNGINAAFAPGLSYFISRHFALEATFGILSYNTVEPKSGNGSTDSFDVGLDLEHINFGIIYKF